MLGCLLSFSAGRRPPPSLLASNHSSHFASFQCQDNKWVTGLTIGRLWERWANQFTNRTDFFGDWVNWNFFGSPPRALSVNNFWAYITGFPWFEPGEFALSRAENAISFYGLIWSLVWVVFYRSNINFLRNTVYSTDYSNIFPKWVRNDFECL